MKAYPSIPRTTRSDVPVYAFDKLDGSNLRAEASRKLGFHKFGKRNHLLDDTNPFLPEGEGLIRAKYEDVLMRILRDHRWESATFFFEFWGPGSFAGNHEPEPHTVTLIDVSVYKKGFMEPRDFLRTFRDIDHAALLYHGNANQPFLRSVENSTLEGMTFEGVVCKGPWDRKTGMPLMFKAKSQAWIQKLKDRCGSNAALFEQLL